MKNERRLLITLPENLRRVVKESAKHRGCSQAEVIRSSLYRNLGDFIDKDNKVKFIPAKKKEEEEINFEELEL